MEQFRQIGEIVGSLKALMKFQNEIQINQRQCSLLVDMYTSAYTTIGDHMKQNLRFEERNTKWRITENPLRELLRTLKEGEAYVKQCLEKDWWAKAISLYNNSDCIEFHVHNLLCCIPVVIEAIELAGEISGSDQNEMQKKKVMHAMKYQKDLNDPKIFEWKFGKQYLVSQDFSHKINSVHDEDRWLLLKNIQEKRVLGALASKQEQRLADIIVKNLNCADTSNNKLLPSSTLLGSKDYQVRRRLGNGSQYKEIQWLGESFALRHFFGDVEPLIPNISQELGLSHPNIANILCGFIDDEKKECFLVMELMNRDLCSYIKEICGPRKKIPFSLPIAVDLMLQIARGMEYLHSKKIYHGELNPSNILVRARNVTVDGYLYVKVSGFGISPAIILIQRNVKSPRGKVPFIWYAPEVLTEQEQSSNSCSVKYTAKSDVYSFGMICFEVLTGKVPFEDNHLQGDKMSRNIKAGERPLFPSHLPKYITNLTKKCWHADPNQRPSFSSICGILRNIKRFLLLSQEDPAIDLRDIEAGLIRSIAYNGSSSFLPISQIPFQMFGYRVMEKEKVNGSGGDSSESGSDGVSVCGDENVMTEDSSSPSSSTPQRRSISPPEITVKQRLLSKKSLNSKANKQPGTPKRRSSVRPPQMATGGRSMRMKSESQLMIPSPKPRRTSGHASDSDLP